MILLSVDVDSQVGFLPTVAQLMSGELVTSTKALLAVSTSKGLLVSSK